MGFTRIPGVDFTNSFALVASDVIMRIIIVSWILCNQHAELLDVEGAFLHGFLEIPIYIHLLEGIEAPPNHCLRLDRSMCSLFQSSRVWWMTFKKYLRNEKFEVTKADQCFLFNKTKMACASSSFTSTMYFFRR